MYVALQSYFLFSNVGILQIPECYLYRSLGGAVYVTSHFRQGSINLHLCLTLRSDTASSYQVNITDLFTFSRSGEKKGEYYDL